MHNDSIAVALLCIALAACAGRAPDPVAMVNPNDSLMDCYAIQNEIAANNQRAQELAIEQNRKVAQNVAAGVTGVWFGTDFQGAAALRERQRYLTGLAAKKKCASPIRPQVSGSR
jgi:hypothetical protein